MVDKCFSYLNFPVGVPQASIYRPILFSDLLQMGPDVGVQGYADDTVILTHARSNSCKEQGVTLFSKFLLDP